MFLVPIAWTFVTAVHLGFAGDWSVLMAHLVMDVLLFLFLVTSWSEMGRGALQVWRTTIAVGLGLTLAGTAGLAATPTIYPLTWLSLVGWMVLPGIGMELTALAGADGPRTYHAGAALCFLGAAGYVLAPLLPGGSAVQVLGVVLVGVGQTAGMFNAAVRS